MADLKTCRLCGSVKEACDITSSIDSIDLDGTTLRNHIAFFCHTKLEENPDLPQSVCRICRLIIETFVVFCSNLGKVEKSFAPCTQLASNAEKKEEILVEVEPGLVSDDDEKLDLNNSSFYQKYTRNQSTISNVAQVYSSYMKQSLLELDCSHVNVDRKHLSVEGEISSAWLADFNIETWKDFTYNCYACKKPFKSLSHLLKHLKRCAPLKIVCNVCNDKIFSTLSAYINHISRVHRLQHLIYTCIKCSKTFYNVAFLIQHSVKYHDRCYSTYPCIECGFYAFNLKEMRVHVLTHEIQTVSDDDSEGNQGESSHAKARSSKKQKKELPCGICDAILHSHAELFDHRQGHQKPKADTFASLQN